MPEITATADDVTYLLRVDNAIHDLRLVLRCDKDGNVWVSINSDSEAGR